MVPPLTALARAVAPVVLYVDSAVLLCELILTILDLPRLKHPSSVLGEGYWSWDCLWSRDGAGMSQGRTWISILSIGSNDMMTATRMNTNISETKCDCYVMYVNKRNDVRTFP